LGELSLRGTQNEMKITSTKLKEILKEELLKEDLEYTIDNAWEAMLNGKNHAAGGLYDDAEEVPQRDLDGLEEKIKSILRDELGRHLNEEFPLDE